MGTEGDRQPTRILTTASVSSLGLEMGIAVLIGCLFGLWLDRHLGTEPWLLLLFLGFGIAAGFKGMFRAAREAQRDSEAAGGESESRT